MNLLFWTILLVKVREEIDYSISDERKAFNVEVKAMPRIASTSQSSMAFS